MQSRQATKDLVGIRDHTVATWGPGQAKVYLKGIRSAVERVAANPSQRQRCEVGDMIRIERVFHQRMDFESRL